MDSQPPAYPLIEGMDKALQQQYLTVSSEIAPEHIPDFLTALEAALGVMAVLGVEPDPLIIENIALLVSDTGHPFTMPDAEAYPLYNAGLRQGYQDLVMSQHGFLRVQV